MKRSKENRIYCSPTDSGWCGPFVQSTYSLSHWFSYFSELELMLGVITSYLTILNRASKAPPYVVGGAHCTRVLTVSKLCMFSRQSSLCIDFEPKISDCY